MNYGLPVSSNYYSVLHPEVVNSTHTAQLSEKNTGVVQAVFQPENSRTWLEMIFNNLLSAGEMYDWLIFTYDSNRATFYNTQNAKYSTAAQNPKQALFAFFSFFSFFFTTYFTHCHSLESSQDGTTVITSVLANARPILQHRSKFFPARHCFPQGKRAEICTLKSLQWCRI